MKILMILILSVLGIFVILILGVFIIIAAELLPLESIIRTGIENERKGNKWRPGR